MTHTAEVTRLHVRTSHWQCRGPGMGVRRLAALLETHRDIYHDELFGNDRLVIDGCDLMEQLYFGSGRDWQCQENHGSVCAPAKQLNKKTENKSIS